MLLVHHNRGLIERLGKARLMETIRYFLRVYPERFYPQTWYERETFLDIPLVNILPEPPFRVLERKEPKKSPLHTAVELVDLFLRYPFDKCWTKYLWTSDKDHLSQRVFVGGVQNPENPQIEIHRHLHLDERFGVPIWRP